MTIESRGLEVEEISQAVFRALREMDTECPTGLCNYVACSSFAGQKRKDEAAIVWGITEKLSKTWSVEQCAHPYPEGGGRCDRVIPLASGLPLWLEVKLAWRTWFYEGIKQNDDFKYKGYFFGDYHSHSVAGDFVKLEQLGPTDARYVALLVVGFDGKDEVMSKDMSALVKREHLVERGWHLLAAPPWPSKQSDECWHRCWFAWRDVK